MIICHKNLTFHFRLQEEGKEMKYVYRNDVLIDKFEDGVKKKILKSDPRPQSPATTTIPSCNGIKGKFGHNIDFSKLTFVLSRILT